MEIPTSPHPTDQTLSDFRLGTLDNSSAAAVKLHIEECAKCRARIGAISSSGVPIAGQKNQGIDRATSIHALSSATITYDGPNPPEWPNDDAFPSGLAELPDYELKRELGRGGMGVVYLAHNKLMGRDEVLKVMGRHIIDKPQVYERFLREIRAVAKLRHPNIVTAYSAARLGQSIALAMEYVEGLDLAKMVRAKGPLPVPLACNFAFQAALGLEHAHEEGLVHRDIKPGNLMLTRKGKKATIKVLDFGLAKATRSESFAQSLTHEGQALGTPDFIAPEQITNAQTVDIRADIYSLGATLYYLLSGRPPFKASSLYDLFQAHISREADPLNLVRPEVPPELAGVVAKMMAKDPARRFQTPRAATEALKPFFQGGYAGFKSPDVEVSSGGGLNKARPMREPPMSAITKGSAPVTGTQTTSTRLSTTPEVRWESLIEFRDDDPSEEEIPHVSDPPGLPVWAWASIAVGVLLAGLVVGWFAITSHDHDGDKSESVDTKKFEPVEEQQPSEDAQPKYKVATIPPEPPAVSPTNTAPILELPVASSPPPASVPAADTDVLYVDTFDNPGSGWPVEDPTIPRKLGNSYHFGYSGGVWFGSGSGSGEWSSPGPYGVECEFQLKVVGRILDATAESRGRWMVHVCPADPNRRGFQIAIERNGVLTLEPSFWNKAALPGEPRIGPIVVRGFRSETEFNTLVLKVRKRQVEVLCNGVLVCPAVTFDWDLTPSRIQFGVDGYKGSYRAEFDRIEIKKLVGESAGDRQTTTAGKTPNLLFFDDFDDPRTRWGSPADSVTPAPLTDAHGYRDGVFFLSHSGPGEVSYECAREFGGDFQVEVSGRVIDATLESRGFWAVHIIPKAPGLRGFQVGIDSSGVLILEPSFWHKNDAVSDPRFGPIAVRGFRRGNRFQSLKLRVKKRQVEVLVNSIRVGPIVSFGWDLTPAALHLGLSTQGGITRAEFDRIEVKELLSAQSGTPIR